MHPQCDTRPDAEAAQRTAGVHGRPHAERTIRRRRRRRRQRPGVRSGSPLKRLGLRHG